MFNRRIIRTLIITFVFIDLFSHVRMLRFKNVTSVHKNQLIYSVEGEERNICPSEDIIHPCRCVQHYSLDVFKTMLICNQTEIIRAGLPSIEYVLRRLTKRTFKSSQQKYFDWLYLINLNALKKIGKTYFSGIRFSNLVIWNAPLLRHIHPGSLKPMNNLLRYFYAYNTGLEHYRSIPFKPPFGAMRNLTEVHIASERNICPPKELIFPCECNIRSRPLMPFNIERHLLQLRCGEVKGKSFNATRIFHRLTELTKNTNQTNWYFDEVILRNVTQLEVNSFGDVDFGELQIEASDLLTHLPSNIFSKNSVTQKLRISQVNFVSDKLAQTFEAINRLRFLRSLYIWSANFDFIPETAFPNWQIYLKEIVLYGNNIRAIGSYAFANLPNLEELSIDGNDIILIDKYAFATNYISNQPLKLSLASNNLGESSLTFMSFNGAQRPIYLSFAESGGCFWEIKHLDESIFAPFLDKNNNRIYLEPECELNCQDCRMRWLVEAPRHVQKRITLLPQSTSRLRISSKEGYIPCKGGANLFAIHEYIDWNVCKD